MLVHLLFKIKQNNFCQASQKLLRFWSTGWEKLSLQYISLFDQAFFYVPQFIFFSNSNKTYLLKLLFNTIYFVVIQFFSHFLLFLISNKLLMFAYRFCDKWTHIVFNSFSSDYFHFIWFFCLGKQLYHLQII